MAKRIKMTRQRLWWAKHPDAVIVARPTKWGNPYRVGSPSAYWLGPGAASPSRPDPIPLMGAQQVVDIYRGMVETGHARFDLDDVKRELAGRDLACWCPLDQPCHADVLLELANPTTREESPS